MDGRHDMVEQGRCGMIEELKLRIKKSTRMYQRGIMVAVFGIATSMLFIVNLSSSNLRMVVWPLTIW